MNRKQQELVNSMVPAESGSNIDRPTMLINGDEGPIPLETGAECIVAPQSSGRAQRKAVAIPPSLILTFIDFKVELRCRLRPDSSSSHFTLE